MRLIPVVLILAASVAVPSAQPSPPDPGASGPYAVGHTSFTIVDSTRDAASPFGGRPIFVNVWYPADASGITGSTPDAAYPLDPFYGLWPVSRSWQWEQFGTAPAYEGVSVSSSKPFPLVVASPGLGTRYFGLLYYGQRLASHGFVVALAQHYHDGYGSDPEPGDPIDTAMLNRPIDVSRMIDSLLATNEDSGSLLFESLQPDRIAAIGHSLGGYAAMVLAGGDDVVCGSPADPLADTCVPAYTSAPDRRIKAIVPLDGSSQLLRFAELARITVPSMAIGEAWD